MTAKTIIEKLKLIRHPEGGYYRETYRCATRVVLDCGKTRNTGTAIYYLLEGTDKSHFHKVASDELWMFHQGEPLEIIMITMDGTVESRILGNRMDQNEEPQFVVMANTWFAARIPAQKGYSLVSCVVTPGFDFADFELANKDELLEFYPGLKAIIDEFCFS